MTSTIFPISLFEELLPKIVEVLELIQQTAGLTSQQAKQKLLQSTNAFKNAISQAKDIAVKLPGGELTIEQQDEIIRLLERLRELKRVQLAEFASKNVVAKPSTGQFKMEVDSLASTPASS